MSLVTPTILVEGTEIDPSFLLTEIDILYEVNRIPYAQLTFLDGDAPSQEFRVSNSAGFVPGAQVEIKLRDEETTGSEGTVFKGIVVKHSLDAGMDKSYLTIELKDKAVRLTSNRKNAVFRNVTDHQIIQQLASDNGFPFRAFSATDVKHQEIIQYYVSDWDFMLARAGANGCWLSVNPNGVTLVNPGDIDTSTPQHNVRYGIDPVFRFQVEADGESQYEQASSIGWNLPELAASSPKKGKDFRSGPGDLNPVDIASAIGNKRAFQQSMAFLKQDELQAWADATLQKSRLAMISGSVTIEGQARIFPLQVLEINGIGDHFNGRAIITGVHHQVDAKSGWRTNIQFGLKHDSSNQRSDIMAPSASGLLPGIRGLQIGIAEAFEKDPDGQYRIRVRIPAFGEKAGPVWARYAVPDAGNQRGVCFLPEPGDELVLGFLNEDPRQVVILGSLFSQSHPPPLSVDAKNAIKGIFTRAGMKVEIDDDNKTIRILTSDKHQITLNDKGKLIELKDINGNTITMDGNGISLKSAKDLKIEAAQRVVIKGMKVDIM